MSEIIRTWLQSRLGLLFEKQTWEEDCGGGILASLLNSYALLNDDQLNIIMSKQGDLYLPTLEVMRLILQNLGIHLKKEEFQDVLDAKGTSVTKLYYELYLLLNNKDTADILLAQKLMEPIKSSRFSVITHEEAYEVNEEIEIDKFDNPLAAALSDREEIVKYHVNKYLELMDKCKKSREEYMTFLEKKRLGDKETNVGLRQSSDNVVKSKQGFDVKELPEDANSLNQSISELVTETKKAKKLRCIVPDSNVAMKIISNIENKSSKTSKNQALRDTFRKHIMNNLWDKLMAEQEDYFKNQFTQKLQQQSLYEQRITSCLLSVRENRHEIAKEKSEMMAHIRDEQEENVINKMFDNMNQKDQERYGYYADRDRQLKLHRKLFERKAKSAQTEIKTDCEEIVKDIVDISLYNIKYQADHCEPVPRRKRDDLARLFVERQPIFDVLSDVTEIITAEESDSSDDDIDPFLLTEFARQNAMDDLTFEDYHTYKWPWDFNSWMKFPEYNNMTMGLNILGHIVHRLLQEKYSKKSVVVTTPVHRPEIAICIDGLHTLDFLPALEQLLHARKVKIIQIKDAIEFCLAAFKDEYTETVLDDIYDAAVENILKDTEKETLKKKAFSKKDFKKGSKIKAVKDKEDRKGEKDIKFKQDSEITLEQIERQIVEKGCQTPNLFPGEEPNISPAARVGKNLFEVINLGEAPDEYLNASALAEYLKSFNYEQVLGWALVNYPQTIQQAVILEETLSGNKVPVEITNLPDELVEGLVVVEPRPGFQYSAPVNARTSKLLDKPKGFLDDDLDFNTFLTAFIEMRTEERTDPDEVIYDCFKTPENKKALCKFYSDQGCKYTLYYKEIDFGTVKHLGKLILGNTTMPPQDSDTLFTDTVHYVEANFADLTTPANTNVVKDGEKKDKKNKKSEKSQETTEAQPEKSNIKPRSKKSKMSDMGKKDKKNKSSKSISKSSDYEEEEYHILTPVAKEEESEESLPPPALPGEYNWTYYDLPIQPYYKEILCTLWENIEDIYTIDMKQLFFRRRTIMDALIPYNTYVKNNMLQFIARPDTKQKFLTDFQLVYNEFELDMREDDEVKAELHMRIEEFREKLWKICDARMLENESERVRIVQENWVTTQLIELCNIYTTFIQLELDRSTDTSQMIVDYYSAMIIGTPCTEPTLNKNKLEIIPLPKTIEDLDHVAPFVEFTEDAMQKVHKFIKEESHLDQKSTTMLKPEKNPFVNKLGVSLNNARANIDANLTSCEKILSNLEKRFNPKADKNKEKKSNKKKGKDKTTSVISEATVQEPDDEVKRHSLELLREFKTVIKGESLRCSLRFSILEHTFNEELQDMLDKSIGGFARLYKLIDHKYKNEINAVDQATKLLKRAVEEETAIQPEMLFENDKFYVKLGSLMYESPLPDDDKVPVCEAIDDDVFSILQLSRIADVLFRLAPTGIIPSKAFTFLIQEFIVHRDDDGKGDFVPKLWKKLPPHKVQLAMNKIFGDTEYLDWKDFIIYCFEVPFPTERELLQIRSKFRALDPDMTEFIHEYQYPQIKFWFEGEAHSPRLQNLRQFLFRLYSCDTRLNYPALLLAFCKDREPILGLAKALVVCLGKMIIADEERGSSQYAKGLKKIIATEIDSIAMNKDRAVSTTRISEEVIEKLIDDTIHCSNSVVQNVLDDDAAPLSTYDVMQYLNQPQNIMYETDSDKQGPHSECEYDSEIAGVSEEVEYHVSFDTMMNIFTVMLPWLHKIKLFGELTFHERFAMLYNSLINEDVRVAYIYQIVKHPHFLKMFENFYKFYDCRVSDIVRKIVEGEMCD